MHKKYSVDILLIRFTSTLTHKAEIVVLMQQKQTYRFLNPMVSLISRPKVIQQSEIESLPYRVCYATEKGKYVYKSMPVADV